MRVDELAMRAPRALHVLAAVLALGCESTFIEGDVTFSAEPDGSMRADSGSGADEGNADSGQSELDGGGPAGGSAGSGGAGSGGASGGAGDGDGDHGDGDAGGAGSSADAASNDAAGSGGEPCEDADNDGVCNAEDTCPRASDTDSDDNGFADACDTLLWEINGRSPADTDYDPYAQLLLLCEGANRISTYIPIDEGSIALDIEPDLVDPIAERILGCADTEAQANVATMMFDLAPVSGIVEQSPVPSTATITRVTLLAVRSGATVTDLRWQIRGYTH